MSRAATAPGATASTASKRTVLKGRGAAIVSKIGLGVLFVFLYIPIGVVIAMSFNSGRSVLRWEGFSLDWYVKAFSPGPLMSGLQVTLIVALTATAIAAVLGTALAIGVHRYTRGPLARSLATLPAFIPDILLGIGILSMFGLFRFAIGMHSVILAHASFEIAIVAAVLLARLGSMDRSLEEASTNLGASGPMTFIRVVLPQLVPAIVAGAALGFTLSLDEFLMAFFTTSTNSQTLPIQIYSMVRFGVTPEVNALAAVMFGASLLAVLLAQRIIMPLMFRRKP